MTQPSSEEALFAEALKLPTAEARAHFLAQACGGDHSLRDRIQALLRAVKEAGEFLENPPTSLLRTPVIASVTEKPGDKIGRYKLREQIGEGGCGVVYVAEQEEPIRRRVALKVIKLGMDTKQVVARFEAERQALALMDHPHIAKVFDAGATETGRPYFVMELVRGIKITDYCDRNNLAVEDRVKLFIQVCSAIQHAHQKGVIHRDIKPSNILITLHDGIPVPKVIDFGIAKATTDQRLTDKTIYTAFEQFIGTPAYMSPEQAEMSGLDIDTRCDIYSLGVLLYELLTGRTPFDSSALLKSGLDQMRRIIREQEPQRPSTRLSTLEGADLNTVATNRQAEPLKLLHHIRGDLDWIVMKSLEKDRTRRYSSASNLGLDLQHHLDHQPVTARPPSQLYRVQKLVLRNKTAVASTFLAGLAAVAALIIGMRISHMSPAGSTQNRGIPGAASTHAGLPAIRPIRAVSGTVLAQDTGRPLADALVRVAAPAVDMRHVRLGGYKLYEGKTDREGHFKIEVPQAESLSLDAFAKGYESGAGTWMAGSRTLAPKLAFPPRDLSGLAIKLPPSLSIAGLVQDENGKPFPDAQVEATLKWENALGYIGFVRTDQNGRFEIFDFPIKPRDKARGKLTFEHPAMLRNVVEDVYALGETDRQNIKVTLHRGHDISGMLTSAGGRPVGKTVVEATPSDPFAQYKRAVTDLEGRFLITGLPDGEIILTAHSFKLEQRAQAALRLAGANAETNLHLNLVVLTNSHPPVTLFGMKLADVTQELQAAYGIASKEGVVILDPGQNQERLGIGNPEEGEYFWEIGSKIVKNTREMVDELLRLSEIDPPRFGGRITEGHRGLIRVVYSNAHRSNTQHLRLNDDDLAELKKVAVLLSNPARKQ